MYGCSASRRLVGPAVSLTPHFLTAPPPPPPPPVPSSEQQYDYHLAAVNTVTFIDQNRRFVSTSGVGGGVRDGEQSDGVSS